jgi:hypothetical protein
MESWTRMIEDQAKRNLARLHAKRNKSLGWDYRIIV